MEQKNTARIASEFRVNLTKLLNQLEKYLTKEEDIVNLDRLRNRLRIAFDTIGDTLVIRKIFEMLRPYHKKIVERDEDFLKNINIGAEVTAKVPSSSDPAPVIDILEQVRSHYLGANAAGKDTLYGLLKTLYQLCLQNELACLPAGHS
jgi:hypothetical protein